MTALSDIDVRARRGSRSRDTNPPRAREPVFDFEGVDAAPAIEVGSSPGRQPAGNDSSHPVAAGFEMAAIRPGDGRAPFDASAAKRPAAWSNGAVFSGGVHLAAITFVLAWGTPAVDPPPPEPVTIEIVAEASAPSAAEASPPPVSTSEPIPPPAAAPRAEPPPAAAAAVEPLPTVEPSASPSPPAAPPRSAPVTHPTPPRIAKPTPPIQKPHPVLRPTRAEPAPAASKPSRIATASPQAAAPSASSAEAAAYQGEVLGRIAAQKRYPEAARDRAPHGVAVVRFSIDASGQLAGASLAQSAGDSLLDTEALATVRRASPFPPPPAGAPRSFSAPLSYRVR